MIGECGVRCAVGFASVSAEGLPEWAPGAVLIVMAMAAVGLFVGGDW